MEKNPSDGPLLRCMLAPANSHRFTVDSRWIQEGSFPSTVPTTDFSIPTPCTFAESFAAVTSQHHSQGVSH